MRVLYAEDNPADRDLTVAHFEETGAGITLAVVATGRQCLARLEDESFDALLLDNRLPDMDGVEVLRQLARRGPLPPTVVVTGVGDEALAVEVLQLGAADYVPKAADYRDRLPVVLRNAVAAGASGRLGEAGRRPRRILYVEHDPADVDLTETHFQTAAPHLDIRFVRSARDALLRLADTSFDLVMADLRLPDMSALELLREARHAGVPVPFVVITGKGDEQTAVAALKLGALDYIVKRDEYLTQLPFVVENAIARSELAASHARLQAELAERERLAAENVELLGGLQQALRARDEFLAIAAHEIRGPLTALRLAVQALAKGKLPADALPSIFEIIVREDRKLAEFVDELLDLGRIRAGTLSLLFVRVDLAAVLSDVVSRAAADLQRSGSALSVSTSGSLVGEWDRSRVEQVIGNLLSNAIKFGLSRPIEIAVMGDDTHVRLRLTDHGVGIPPEARHRIFEPFEREQSPRNYGGMGLGLYIVQTIVNRLHGTLAVESEPGVGSTFTVSLPKVRPA